VSPASPGGIAASGGPSSFAPGQPDAVPAAAGPWQMVTVSTPSGAQGPAMSFEVPAVEREHVDPQWLENLPPAVPDDVLQAFNRTGHQVQQHRQLVPIPMKDGRRLIVPVDQVDIQPVGYPTY
jgi:hypothetical protein